MAPVKRFVLFAVALGFAVPAPAQAAVPCRNKIFNEWYSSGKIASTYPRSCYVDALRHIPSDASVYSNLGDDVKAAMQASIRRLEGKSVPKEIGHGFSPVSSAKGGVKGVSTAVVSSSRPMTHDPAAKGEQRVSATVASGPVASSSGSGTPLPILVLGGLAIALAAAGALGAGVKYARGRRRAA